MPRGHGDARPRRERRHRDVDDRHHTRRHKSDREPHAPVSNHHSRDRSPPPEYTPHPDPHVRSDPRRPTRDDAPPLRRRGLNHDYYNPPEEVIPPRKEHRHSSRKTHEKPPRHSRRRYSSPSASEDEGDFLPTKPSRRSKTESRGRRTHRNHFKYESDEPSETDGYSLSEPERPAKPGRGKSFLNALGLGKDKSKHDSRDYERGRSPYRSPSRGRRGHRDSSYSPSPPPREYRRARASTTGHVGGMKNKDWQRAASSAMRAGASAAYELRHDPSPLVGPKGIKIATAALGAAVMDSFMDDDTPRHRSRGRGTSRGGGLREKAMRGVGEAALRHIITGGGRSRSSRRY